jgi:hypothetical protein
MLWQPFNQPRKGVKLRQGVAAAKISDLSGRGEPFRAPRSHAGLSSRHDLASRRPSRRTIRR